MNRFPMSVKVFAVFCISLITVPAAVSEKNATRILYGNIYGTILNAAGDQPIAEARVHVMADPITMATRDHPDAVLSNAGWIVLPELSTAVGSSISSEDGSYLVNGIPIDGYAQLYTVIIKSGDAPPVIVDTVRIFPGAAMALQIDINLPDGEMAQVISEQQTSDAVTTNNYRHKLSPLAYSPQTTTAEADLTAAGSEAAYALNIYATREGLVGGTTANGHVIQERDHFVALPSTRVLSSKGGHEFQVRLEYRGRTETVPVWDIGPWNIHDNYWDAEEKRLIYNYLSNGGQSGGLGRGLPESQAAFLDDFNGGYDEFGREVLNPAGIDLADGTFWDALQMTDNDWINVTYLWLEDDEDNSSTCFIGCLLD